MLLNRKNMKLLATALCAVGFLTATIPGKSLLAKAATQDKPQEKSQKQEQPSMLPAPGPEMDKMKFLVGLWDYNGEYKKTAMVPDGGKESGWYKAQPGPGGFSLIADFDVDGPMGKEIGHELIAWDPGEKAYKVYIAGNSFPGVVAGTGRWEGADFVITSEFNYGGTKFTLRSKYTDIRPGSVAIEEESKQGDGPFQMIFTAKATRK
jgi:hypothetical protein